MSKVQRRIFNPPRPQTENPRNIQDFNNLVRGGLGQGEGRGSESALRTNSEVRTRVRRLRTIQAHKDPPTLPFSRHRQPVAHFPHRQLRPALVRTNVQSRGVRNKIAIPTGAPSRAQNGAARASPRSAVRGRSRSLLNLLSRARQQAVVFDFCHDLSQTDSRRAPFCATIPA